MARLVFINPWVHDFSYYNLWNAPLGLYRVMEFFSQFECDLSFIDCADAPFKEKPDGRSHVEKVRIEKPAVYRQIPRYYYQFGISEKEFKQKVEACLPADAFLLTSHMAYWYGGVKKTIEVLRKMVPKVPIIVGGIYATLYPEHAGKVLGCDCIYSCHSLERGNPLLSYVGDPHFRGDDSKKSHWSSFVPLKKSAPIKTSYGCPFKCTYCAAHILSPEFRQPAWQEVASEIEILYKKGVRHFAIYDDALLVNAEKHFVPLFKTVAEKFPDAFFYTPVGFHSRFVSCEVAELMKMCNFSYLRMGYETKDKSRQFSSGGKITDDDLLQAVDNLCTAGYSAKDIGVFNMYGLPGQPFEEVVASVEWLKTLGVRIALTEYSPIKGTEAMNNISQNLIDEPLYTNNKAFYFLFSDYLTKEIEKIKLLIK